MLIELALFVAGLAFGSFLNVCITRIPRDESVVRPRSHCRDCGAQLHWHDNIPLLSFAVLRGRCRACHSPIPFRYPAVELLTGVVFAACYASFGPSWLTLKYCIFGFLVIGLIYMDAETGLLVHEFTYPGVVLGLAFAWIAPGDSGGTQLLALVFHWNISSIHMLSLLDSFIAALVGGGFFYLAWALYYLFRKRHGLGFGDVALMTMSGAFLGLKMIVLVIVCAPLITVAYILILLLIEPFRRERDTEALSEPEEPSDATPDEEETAPEEAPFLQREIPFGVFLGACSLAAIFFGEAAWRWYVGKF